MEKYSTTFMGLKLKNPLIVSACSMTSDIEKVKKDLDADIVGLNELIITFQSAIDEDWEIIKEKYNEIFND